MIISAQSAHTYIHVTYVHAYNDYYCVGPHTYLHNLSMLQRNSDHSPPLAPVAVPFLQELVRCEREQCCSQLEAEEQHHRSLLEQKQQAKRAKRVALVQDTLERVLDLAVKMCHYKEETNG